MMQALRRVSLTTEPYAKDESTLADAGYEQELNRGEIAQTLRILIQPIANPELGRLGFVT